MLKITKSEYPNLHKLVQIGSLFYERKDPPDNLCRLIRRLCYGVLNSFLIIGMLSFTILCIISPIINLIAFLIISGPGHLMPLLLVICGFLIYAIFLVLLSALLYYSDFGEDLRAKTSIAFKKHTPELQTPGIIKTWYHGFKHKYCPTVYISDE